MKYAQSWLSETDFFAKGSVDQLQIQAEVSGRIAGFVAIRCGIIAELATIDRIHRRAALPVFDHEAIPLLNRQDVTHAAT